MQENNTDNNKKVNVPEKSLPIKTLTKSELHKTAKERVSLISEEFTKGFEFLEKYPKSVTFFGSARFTEDNVYYQKARSIAGKIVKELGYSVLSGGGPGIMEAANRGAFENNGSSLGLSVDIPTGQAINPYVKENIEFYYFFSRKVCLSFSAEAYLFFPGGFGTFDEVYEILTLVQTHKIEKVPIILVGADFWKAIEETMHKEMLSRGMIDNADIELYKITDDEDEIIDIIRKAPIRNGVPFNLPKKENSNGEKLSEKRCIPCEEGGQPMSKDAGKKLLEEINQWIMVENDYLEKTIHLKNFKEAVDLINKIAEIAEIEGHHPDIHLFDYNKIRIVLSTHKIKGLSENDFILASKIDEVLR